MKIETFEIAEDHINMEYQRKIQVTNQYIREIKQVQNQNPIMLKPHKNSNTSQKKGGSFMKILKRSLKDLAKEDQNCTPMSSNGSSPHKKIDSSKVSIPTPLESLQEPSIASLPNNIPIKPILEDPIQSSSPSYPSLNSLQHPHNVSLQIEVLIHRRLLKMP